MEKQIKMKSKMLKILPKAVTAVTLTFHNHPFSPGRDHHHHHQSHKSRQKEINANKWVSNGITEIDYQEPTSPKISCMGQIKHNKKKAKTPSRDIEVKKKHVTTFQKMLFHVGKPKSAERRKSDISAAQDNKYVLEDESPPRVSHMKRFASGRDTFANFDWKKEAEDEVIIPFSAPLLVGGGGGAVLDLKPRKEINLWKRRTMAPPTPLQLDPIV